MPLHIPIRTEIYDSEETGIAHGHDAEVVEAEALWAIKKEITVGWLLGHDSVKVDFDLKSSALGVPVYGRLYVNDAAVGIQQSESGVSYVTKTETLTGISDLDKIQLFLLALTGKNLVSASFSPTRFYVQAGLTGTVIRYFTPVSANSYGLVVANGDLISVIDGTTDKIYVHDGITSTIKDSFATPSTRPRGITFDGTNLISCDRDTGLIYVHVGISGAISSSFASPVAQPLTLTFDGANLIIGAGNKIYVQVGISSVNDHSFDAPVNGACGLDFDGENLISADGGTDKTYVHDGVTAAILDEFDSPSGAIHGIALYEGLSIAHAQNFRIIGEMKELIEVTAFSNTI